MIVSELRFKDFKDFVSCDADWLRDAIVGPESLYSPEAKQAARKAQECLMRLVVHTELVKQYIEARDEAFKAILAGGKVDSAQLSLFESDA